MEIYESNPISPNLGIQQKKIKFKNKILKKTAQLLDYDKYLGVEIFQ